jgi:hypothetical protein
VTDPLQLRGSSNGGLRCPCCGAEPIDARPECASLRADALDNYLMSVLNAVAHHAQVLDSRALGHPDYALLDRDDIDNHLYNAVRDISPEWWDEKVPGLRGAES